MSERRQERDSFPVNLEYGKLPPQAPDIEEAVLGAIMLEKNAILEVRDILQPESFYREENQKIYGAIVALFNERKAIDLLTVPEQLRKTGELDDVGGIAYIAQLTDKVASAAHVEQHAKIVQDKFLLRELIRISSNLQDQAFDDGMDPDLCISYGTEELFKLRHNIMKTNPELIGDIGGVRLKELFEMAEDKKDFYGIPTGFNKLDRITGGWQNADLIYIAGRPSMGKTLFALMLTYFPAKLGIPIALFSIEMSRYQIYDRSLSYVTGIDSMKLRGSDLNPGILDELERAQGKIEKYPIYVDDPTSLTVEELRAKVLRLMVETDIKMIVIDYIQLMIDKNNRSNREREISEISRGLKAIAKELNIPVIALSQLNRSVEMRGDKKPQLSDLRESGSLEQDADLVLFIHRPEYYSDQDEHKKKVEILIRKHRNGKIGDLTFYRDENFTHINESNLDEELFSKPPEKNEQDEFYFEN